MFLKGWMKLVGVIGLMGSWAFGSTLRAQQEVIAPPSASAYAPNANPFSVVPYAGPESPQFTQESTPFFQPPSTTPIFPEPNSAYSATPYPNPQDSGQLPWSEDLGLPSGTPDPPLDPRTLEAMTMSGGPDPWSIESPFFYRAGESSWRVLARGQAGFGETSWERLPYLSPESHSGLITGAAVRFLEGPLTPNLHPRLYDFNVKYQHRATLLNGWSFDVALGVGAFSDFEGSAVEGIRFPGHAVLSGPLTPQARWVAGVDYLDRDDIAWFPVAGIRFEPYPDLQIHAEFPRPMIRWLTDNRAIYLRAELGGGTWAIEPVGRGDDVMTYREISVLYGVENRHASGDSWGGIEIGYVTGRRLEYRSGLSSQDLPDAWVFRFINRF